MSFIDQEHNEQIVAAMNTYSRAITEYPVVKSTFNHRISSTPSSLMEKYSKYLHSYMFSIDVPVLYSPDQFGSIIGKFIYDDVTRAIIEYSKSGVESSLDTFMYNPVTQRSMFLQTLYNIRNKATSSDVESLLGKAVYQKILHIQDIHKIPMLDKIKKLVVWYRSNCERIAAGNPGTFPLSPLRTVNEFIKELTLRAIHDYSVYHINSPQWFIFAEYIEETYHVDMYTSTSFQTGRVPDYDLTIIKTSDILKPFQGGNR